MVTPMTASAPAAPSVPGPQYLDSPLVMVHYFDVQVVALVDLINEGDSAVAFRLTTTYAFSGYSGDYDFSYDPSAESISYNVELSVSTGTASTNDFTLPNLASLSIPVTFEKSAEYKVKALADEDHNEKSEFIKIVAKDTSFFLDSQRKVVIRPVGSATIYINGAPVANNDSVTTVTDASITIDPLKNDSDEDGNPISLNSIVSQPSHGSVTMANSKFTYTPSKGFIGNDSFSYQIKDIYGAAGVGTVSVKVTSPVVNSRPNARNDTASVVAGSTIKINVLSNDSDPDGDTITLSDIVSQSSHGTAVITSDGYISYISAAGYSGADTLRYQIKDSQGSFSEATVSITVTQAIPWEDNYFSIYAYAAKNADLFQSFGLNTSALIDHYQKTGRNEGRMASGFSPYAYAAFNKDLYAAYGLNAQALTAHYIQYGRKEGRSASGFDPLAYAARNSDLFAVFGTNINLLTNHYVNTGRHENRSGTGFDVFSYAAMNPDLFKAFGVDELSLISHYVSNGKNENRKTTGFDPVAYSANYQDIFSSYGTDAISLIYHYINNGKNEGRKCAQLTNSTDIAYNDADYNMFRSNYMAISSIF
ncbi:Ig-like domain-containing protein [Azospirillum palustre]